jgi:hypothetical protein
MQLRAIDFLREVARLYDGQVPALMYAGIVGPHGDAYDTNQTITAERRRTTTADSSPRWPVPALTWSRR